MMFDVVMSFVLLMLLVIFMHGEVIGSAPRNLEDEIREQVEYSYRNHTVLSRLDNGISAIVLSYNHIQNIERISKELQTEHGISEIIVAEDGSRDGSYEKWIQVLRTNIDKIVQTNNVHEIRAYNNAAKHANGSILCFLQDDDIPSDQGWARQVIALMNNFRHERLGLISGLATEICQYEIGEQQVEHPPSMKNFKKTQPIPYIYKDQFPFMFTTEAWLSPLCIRSDIFREDLSPGFDESLAKSGEPGIGLDIHLSLRAAILGFTIGVHGAKFQRGIGGHGSVSDTKKATITSL